MIQKTNTRIFIAAFFFLALSSRLHSSALTETNTSAALGGPGEQTTFLDTGNPSEGIYFVKLSIGNFVETVKMVKID